MLSADASPSRKTRPALPMQPRPIRLLFMCLSLALTLWAAAPVRAQDAPPADRPSAAEVDQLITTLEDPARRDALLAQLKALKALEKPALAS